MVIVCLVRKLGFFSFHHDKVIRIMHRLTKLLAVILIVSGCSGEDQALSQEINKLRATRTSSLLDLTSIGNMDWDRMCFVGPYTRDVSTVLGFAWSAKATVSIRTSARDTLIILGTKDSVTQHVLHPLGEGDFSSLSGLCVSRDKAAFNLEKRNDGWEAYQI